jgi:hypothetical protein
MYHPHIVFLLLITILSTRACGQTHQHQKNNKMNYQLITNGVAQGAIKAWQEADRSKWLSYFSDGALLYDDGDLRDFLDFSTHAIGDEYFVSFDKIEDGGTTLFGHFHTKKYGDFKARFHFYINSKNKITRLDINQAKC